MAGLTTSAGHEPWESHFAWLKFGFSNGFKKNSNSTQFMLWFWRQREAIKPLQLVGQAAEFKFESKFEPLPVIWQSLPRLFQKVIEGLEGKINGQALRAALRLCPSGSVRSDGRAQNTGRFRVGGSRCGQRPGRLKKTCYQSCDADSSQKGFNDLYFGQRRVTFVFQCEMKISM